MILLNIRDMRVLLRLVQCRGKLKSSLLCRDTEPLQNLPLWEYHQDLFLGVVNETIGQEIVTASGNLVLKNWRRGQSKASQAQSRCFICGKFEYFHRKCRNPPRSALLRQTPNSLSWETWQGANPRLWRIRGYYLLKAFQPGLTELQSIDCNNSSCNLLQKRVLYIPLP